MEKYEKWALVAFYSVVLLSGSVALWAVVGALTLIAIIVIASVVVVPKDHYTEVLTWGKRVPDDGNPPPLLEEGWHFIVPFFQNVDELVKNELVDANLEVEVLSKDRLGIRVKGSAQYRFDLALIRKFKQVPAVSICGGLRDSIKESLGIIAGAHGGGAFIEKREAILLLVECTLRLSRAPHLDPEGVLNGGLPAEPPVVGLDHNEIKPRKRLAFYEKNTARIRLLLAREKENVADRSRIETTYGVDVEEFSLASIAFSKTTQEALGAKQRADGEMKAVESREEEKDVIIAKRKIQGMSSGDALIDAQVSVGQATRVVTTHDVRGIPEGGLFRIF